MKKILIPALLFANSLIAQQSYKFDSLKVIDGLDTFKVNCKSSIIYFPKGFTLISSDSRLYSYLVPGSEFHNLQYISFADTGVLLEDTTSTNPVVVYQTKFKNTQIAQYIYEGKIAFKKRNNSSVIFY